MANMYIGNKPAMSFVKIYEIPVETVRKSL